MALTQVPASMQESNAQYTGFKNRIINGAMMIDQRNAGASVTNVAGAVYTVDRWLASGSQASKFTGQQSTTAPTGFKNSLACTSSSAYSVGTAETFAVQHRIEGFNVADLGWGTAGASTVTLSFWVRSSLTGTFGGSLRNSAGDRSYPFSYTINSANTWEQKSITIAGDISGTWLTDNGIGITLIFSLGAGATLSGTAGSWAGVNYLSATGATSVVGTSGATFYITGVQLEKGSTATSFDYRPYGTELALCQRYYQIVPFVGTAVTTSEMGTSGIYKVTMRTVPSLNSVLRPGLSYTGTDNQIIRFGIGPAGTGAATFGTLNDNMYASIICTGLAVGGVFGGSTTASAEL